MLKGRESHLEWLSDARLRGPGGKNMDFVRKSDFLECREKRSEFDLGSAFFGISDLGFLPYGVHIKGLIEKALIFEEKC